MKPNRIAPKPKSLPAAFAICPACGIVVDTLKFIEHLRSCDANRRG